MPADELSEQDRARTIALYRKGMALIDGRISLSGAGPFGPPGWFTRWQLRRGIRCFEEVLALDTKEWQSMLCLGMIYQRLGDHEVAVDWLSRCHTLNPAFTPAAKELAMEALSVGRIPEAVAACEAAVKAQPKDPELLSNLAVAYCFAARDKDAERVAQEAVGNDPDDKISARVLDLVRAVASGNRPRPRRMSDLQARK